MRGATVKLCRAVPWWTIPSTAGVKVETWRQKKRYLLRGTTARQRGGMRNGARFMGWFKDGKPKRLARGLAVLLDCLIAKVGTHHSKKVLAIAKRAAGYKEDAPL